MSILFEITTYSPYFYQLIWRRTINNLDKNDHSKLEFQGYSFGGLILAPPKELEEQFVQNIEQVLPLRPW